VISYRIADARHPIFDPTGAMLHGGRWNSAGHRVIYAAETYAGALLEVLVHANLSEPPRHHRVVRVHIPDDLVIETVLVDQVKGWDTEDLLASCAFGDQWIVSRRTVILRVPSVITHGREFNLVLNANHPDFIRITADAPEAIHWDKRLFRK
jgi:RES domain-containing protein